MLAAGIDIGGTKCAVSVGNVTEDHVELVAKKQLSTGKGRNPEVILEDLYKILSGLVPVGQLSRIGISCGGPLSSREGLILSPPNLPGWDRVEVARFFSERTGVPVKLENDANACALAEWKFGAGRGTENMVFLTCGTGMGAGLILNGRLFRGASDMAGEIGHIRMSSHGPVGYGKEGSYEGFCSGGGIAQLGRTIALEQLQRGKTTTFCPGVEALDQINAKQLAACARQGDPLALEVFRISGTMLGRGLAVLADLLNPEAIVIGSIYTRCEDLLRPHAIKVLESESLAACRVLKAGLGEQVGDFAALAAAVNEDEKEKTIDAL